MDKPIITIGNIWSGINNIPDLILKYVPNKKRVMTPYTLLDCISDEISYEVPNLHFIMQSYPNWDGRIRLFNISNAKKRLYEAKFLTGLISRVIRIIHENTGILPTIKDIRKRPGLNFNWEWSPEFSLRDYQLPVVEECVRKGRGLIDVATGGGKTLIVAKIIQEIGVSPFIFYVLTKDLMYQTQARFEEYMPNLKCGIIGDGNCDIKDINIMTVQTATLAYGEKDLKKELLKIDGWGDGEIKLITSEKLDHLSRKEEIKDIIQRAKGVYMDECLVGDTRILNKNGIPVKIENIRNNEEVVGGRVSNYFSKNVNSVKEVIHSCGKLICTNTHKHIIINHDDLSKGQRKLHLRKPEKNDVEERSTNKLKINDFLLIPTFVKHSPEINNNLTFNQMRFISAIMSDGHIEKTGYKVKINVKKDKEWFREVFKEGLKDFGIEEYGDKIDCRGNLLLYVNNKFLNNFLVNYAGIPRGEKSKKIKINDFLWNNSLESLEGFIDGSFGSEGDVSKNRVNISNSVSYDNICDLQLLLLKFGINSNIQVCSKRKNKNHNQLYRLSVMGSGIEKLKQLKITMNRKLQKILDIKNSNISKKQVVYNGKAYYLSKIKSIKQIDGNFEVFDFTCDDHTFIANNTLTHNCHHSAAKTCKDVITRAERAYFVFGGTATPFREDNADLVLEGLFGPKRGSITASYLIKRGFLVKPDIYFIKLKENAKRIVSYDEDYKENLVYNEERNGIIVSLAKKMMERNLPTLILIKIIEHGNHLKSLIPGSVFVNGKTSKNKRKKIMKDFEEGKIKILIASVIADEGLDIPILEALILAGGGKSKNRMRQRVGRVIRKNKKNPNKKSYVFDFEDNGIHLSKHSRMRKKILKTEEEFNVNTIGSITEMSDFFMEDIF